MHAAEHILEFVREIAPSGVEIGPGTSLFEGQILDSFRLVEVLSFLEREFGVRVTPSEIIFANLDSVEKMADLVARKRS